MVFSAQVKNPATAGSGDDHQVHRHEHQVVMPAARLLPPEARLPLECLLLDRPEADEDQAERGQLDQDTGDQPDAAQSLRSPDPQRRGGAELVARPAGSRRWK